MLSDAEAVISNEGVLPAYLDADNGVVAGTGSLLALFCELYLDKLSGELKDSYRLVSFDPYPRENEAAIIEAVEGCKYWIVHRPDLDMSSLVEKTRLQLWTLKPAREAPGLFGN